MKTYIRHLIVVSALVLFIACLFAMVNADNTAIDGDPIIDLTLLADESNDNVAITEPEESTDVINNLNLILSDKNIIETESDEMKSELTIAETGSSLLKLLDVPNGNEIDSIQKYLGDSLLNEISSGNVDIGSLSPAESTMICDSSTGICRFVSIYSMKN